MISISPIIHSAIAQMSLALDAQYKVAAPAMTMTRLIAAKT